MKKLILLLALAVCLNGKAQIITTVAGNGTGAYAGDGGQAINAELKNPANMTLSSSGNLYIADGNNNRIRMVSTSGFISTIAGTGTSGYSGDGGHAIFAELNYPTAVVFDAVGNLFIADGNNYLIRKINTSGFISTVAGNYSASGLGDGGPATAAQLFGPYGIALDAIGNLFIADGNNMRVRMVNTSGIITTVAGNGTFGYSGDGGDATAAELSYPTGVAVDAGGNLYIADNGNNRIRMVNTNGIITTIAGNGTSSYSGDGGQATVAELDHPLGVSTDINGNIYISDTQNSSIRRVNTSGIIATIAGTGTAGYGGDGGQATNAQLNYPTGVAFDYIGNMYVADNGNSRIRMITNIAAASIEQFATNKEQVTIYPNPTSSVLHIVLRQAQDDNGTLVITDMLGNTVKQVPFNTQHSTINITDLSEGIYNLSISGKEGVVNKRVVIVR